MSDLFKTANSAAGASGGYSAEDIEVLEGLEPVRRRPGMYVGGVDDQALHHLVAEVLDNSMDEAVAGHANRIEVELRSDGAVTVTDNGRGIPVDPHPKYKNKSALEVILTTLHSGGKFSDKAYQTAGGLHGVGVSVVNALSEWLVVEVARDRRLWRQRFARGTPQSPLEDMGTVSNRRGTSITFLPDGKIFGPTTKFQPIRLFRMVRSKAYLFKGVEIRWHCAADLLKEKEDIPVEAVLHFPGGLVDFLSEHLGARPTLTPRPFAGNFQSEDRAGRVEWAVAWAADGDGLSSSYCNTVPTPQGGNHESALRSVLARGLRTYGDMTGVKNASRITAEDAAGGASAILSVFISDPQFQGQTKEKLNSPEAAKLVETALRDRFDLWLAEDPAASALLLERILERANERLYRRQKKETARKTPGRRLRLPGKLADCTRDAAEGTEIFLVEGDSAGGSAKQARDRTTQAVLPLRGKILNVASASMDKLQANQELKDLVQALGCGTRSEFRLDRLRYERVIIMTDADVDGAHIAALLMTFFYREMPKLVEAGRLFLALPPLYRLSQGGKTAYARDETHRDELLTREFTGRGRVDISRFKGLGEMPPAQLKETTMAPDKRMLVQVQLPNRTEDGQLAEARRTAEIVETLMGRKPEKRFIYIQQNAQFMDVDLVDV